MAAPQAAFEQALAQCALEPIHLIGSVQPHGMALVFEDAHEQRLCQYTENAPVFLNRRVDVGMSLLDLLGEYATTEILKLKASAERHSTAMGRLSKATTGISCLLAHVYQSVGVWVLELEEDEDEGYTRRFAERLLQTQQSMMNSNAYADVNAYLEQLAGLVRDVTGFDSVMVYRFDAEWNGEIISQRRTDCAPCYLGMHFPSSDIPEQARRLYTTNLVRVVVDVDAVPVAFTPHNHSQTPRPLDMTYSALRSLSPIHIEYLKNIGIQASMTISLMQSGRLWGLIACHHMTPKRVSMEMREAGIFISRLASVRLSSVEAQEKQLMTNQASQISGELLKVLPSDAIDSVVNKLMPELQHLMRATGLLIVVNGKIFRTGILPSQNDCQALLQWLGEQDAGAVFATNHLGLLYLPAHEFVEQVAGVLSTPPNQGMNNAIIWFRQEKPKTVNWAGHYEEGFVQNSAGNYRLTPRKSFELWSESWRGRCEPWSVVERDVATMLAWALPEALAQKQKLDQALTQRDAAERALKEHLDQLEIQVEARTADLSLAKDAAEAADRAKTAFLSNMSHELRTPLNGMMGMAELAKRRATDEKQIEYLDRLLHSSQNLLDLISNVLEITRSEAVNGGLDVHRFSLLDLLQNVETCMQGLARAKGLMLSFDVPSCLEGAYFLGDSGRIRQVLLSLVGNAIKFTADGFVAVAVAIDDRSADSVCVSFDVSDSGLGIKTEDIQRIFLPFEQVDSSSTRLHGGAGLGLTLCRQLVESMGGTIWVKSQHGVGSTFMFKVIVDRC